MTSSNSSSNESNANFITGSERPSIQKIIKHGTRIDKLYLKSYLPLRERKLLDKLNEIKLAYDDAFIKRETSQLKFQPCKCSFTDFESIIDLMSKSRLCQSNNYSSVLKKNKQSLSSRINRNIKKQLETAKKKVESDRRVATRSSETHTQLQKDAEQKKTVTQRSSRDKIKYKNRENMTNRIPLSKSSKSINTLRPSTKSFPRSVSADFVKNTGNKKKRPAAAKRKHLQDSQASFISQNSKEQNKIYSKKTSTKPTEKGQKNIAEAICATRHSKTSATKHLAEPFEKKYDRNERNKQVKTKKSETPTLVSKLKIKAKATQKRIFGRGTSKISKAVKTSSGSIKVHQGVQKAGKRLLSKQSINQKEATKISGDLNQRKRWDGKTSVPRKSKSTSSLGTEIGSKANKKPSGVHYKRKMTKTFVDKSEGDKRARQRKNKYRNVKVGSIGRLKRCFCTLELPESYKRSTKSFQKRKISSIGGFDNLHKGAKVQRQNKNTNQLFGDDVSSTSLESRSPSTETRKLKQDSSMTQISDDGKSIARKPVKGEKYQVQHRNPKPSTKNDCHTKQLNNVSSIELHQSLKLSSSISIELEFMRDRNYGGGVQNVYSYQKYVQHPHSKLFSTDKSKNAHSSVNRALPKRCYCTLDFNETDLREERDIKKQNVFTIGRVVAGETKLDKNNLNTGSRLRLNTPLLLKAVKRSQVNIDDEINLGNAEKSLSVSPNINIKLKKIKTSEHNNFSELQSKMEVYPFYDKNIHILNPDGERYNKEIKSDKFKSDKFLLNLHSFASRSSLITKKAISVKDKKTKIPSKSFISNLLSDIRNILKKKQGNLNRQRKENQQFHTQSSQKLKENETRKSIELHKTAVCAVNHKLNDTKVPDRCRPIIPYSPNFFKPKHTIFQEADIVIKKGTKLGNYTAHAEQCQMPLNSSKSSNTQIRRSNLGVNINLTKIDRMELRNKESVSSIVKYMRRKEILHQIKKYNPTKSKNEILQNEPKNKVPKVNSVTEKLVLPLSNKITGKVLDTDETYIPNLAKTSNETGKANSTNVNLMQNIVQGKPNITKYHRHVIKTSDNKDSVEYLKLCKANYKNINAKEKQYDLNFKKNSKLVLGQYKENMSISQLMFQKIRSSLTGSKPFSKCKALISTEPNVVNNSKVTDSQREKQIIQKSLPRNQHKREENPYLEVAVNSTLINSQRTQKYRKNATPPFERSYVVFNATSRIHKNSKHNVVKNNPYGLCKDVKNTKELRSRQSKQNNKSDSLLTSCRNSFGVLKKKSRVVSTEVSGNAFEEINPKRKKEKNWPSRCESNVEILDSIKKESFNTRSKDLKEVTKKGFTVPDHFKNMRESNQSFRQNVFIKQNSDLLQQKDETKRFFSKNGENINAKPTSHRQISDAVAGLIEEELAQNSRRKLQKYPALTMLQENSGILKIHIAPKKKNDHESKYFYSNQRNRNEVKTILPYIPVKFDKMFSKTSFRKIDFNHTNKNKSIRQLLSKNKKSLNYRCKNTRSRVVKLPDVFHSVVDIFKKRKHKKNNKPVESRNRKVIKNINQKSSNPLLKPNRSNQRANTRNMKDTPSKSRKKTFSDIDKNCKHYKEFLRLQAEYEFKKQKLLQTGDNALLFKKRNKLDKNLKRQYIKSNDDANLFKTKSKPPFYHQTVVQFATVKKTKTKSCSPTCPDMVHGIKVTSAENEEDVKKKEEPRVVAGIPLSREAEEFIPILPEKPPPPICVPQRTRDQSRYTKGVLVEEQQRECDAKCFSRRPLFEMRLFADTMEIQNPDEVLEKVTKLRRVKGRDYYLLKKAHGDACCCCVCTAAAAAAAKEALKKAKKEAKEAAELRAMELFYANLPKDHKFKIWERKQGGPCICTSRICRYDYLRLVYEAFKRTTLTGLCTCGTDICEVELIMQSLRDGTITKEVADNLLRERILRSGLRKKQQARQAQIARLKHYVRVDNEVRRKALLKDKEADEEVRTSDPDEKLIFDSINDVFETVRGIITRTGYSLFNKVIHLSDTIQDTIHMFEDHRVLKNLQNVYIRSGVTGTAKRVARRTRGLKFCGVLLDKFEDTGVGNRVMTVLTKSDQKRDYLRMVREARKEKPITDFGCSLYMASMRHKKYLWVYRRCPWFYPHFNGLVKVWKSLMEAFMFLLAVVVWSPCILCMEACRTVLCGAMCSG